MVFFFMLFGVEFHELNETESEIEIAGLLLEEGVNWLIKAEDDAE